LPGNISKEYRRWWSKLTEKERRDLIASGAFKADALDDPSPVTESRMNQDKFDFSEHHTNDDQFHRLDPSTFSTPSALDDVIANETTTDPRLAELDLASFRLRATLHFLLESLDKSTDPDMSLTADIIRLVVGEGCPPRMTVLARRHGITRSAVSLRCRKLLRQLGLEPSRFMRPEEEVKNMRAASVVRRINGKTPDLLQKTRIFVDFHATTPPGKESIRVQGGERSAARPRFICAKTVSQPKGAGGNAAKSVGKRK
jgi:hypothetical protein